jgi:hypothetical protein
MFKRNPPGGLDEAHVLQGMQHKRWAAPDYEGWSAETRTAQYLNSGILPNGSSAALVSSLAAAST